MNNQILVFGDSIVWGAWDSEGGWANRLKKYSSNQTINNQMENYNAVYPLGISGDNTDGLLKRFECELDSRLDSNLVIVIAIGINDSQFALSNNKNRVPTSTFKSNLLKIFNLANKYTKQIALVGLTPVDDKLLNPMPWKATHGYRNTYVQKYDNILKTFAKEKKIPFIDIYNDFINRDYKSLLKDGLHPNTKGHEIIYAKVLTKLNSLEILE